ncbi:MAG: type I methionyl aminopeptidase [Holosporaceae bacterium]|jgi:methionyl aminopeptidase|nr:type I methionyl aminopeptidase [Holosporaceae bacterium]
MSTKKCPEYAMEDYRHLREAGALAAYILDYITPHVVEGISTIELDKLCHEEITRHHALAAPLNYEGYPNATCISVNHVVCHGIPSNQKLANGDILNIDITVIVNGWYGDSSRMYTVGKVSNRAMELVDAAYDSLMLAIDIVKPGTRLGDIGHAIQSFAEARKFSVVRDYCGHGIGRVFHDEPLVLHFGSPGTGMMLKPGHVFTIEPMLNIGGYKTELLADNWTVVTKDRSLSAQFEHTLGVTADGCEVFTLSRMGLDRPPHKLGQK